MNQVSTEVKTHVVLTIKGQSYFIDKTTFDKIACLDFDQSILIEDSLIPLRSVGEITTVEKYYESHPEKLPERTPPYFKAEEVGTWRDAWSDERLAHARAQMIDGYKKSLLAQGKSVDN